MDEKYVELRIRFDQSRSIFQNNVNKILKENAELRKKFSLAFGTNIMLDTFDTNKGMNRIRAKSANNLTNKSSSTTPIITNDDNNNNKLQQQSGQQYSPDGKYYKDDSILMSNTMYNTSINNLFINTLNNKNNLNTTLSKSNMNSPTNNINNKINIPERNHSAPIRRSSVNHDINDDSLTKGLKEKDILKKISKRAKKKEWTQEQLRELIPKF